MTLTPPVVPPRGTATVQVDAIDPDGDQVFYRFAAETGTVTPDPGNPSRATYVHAGGTAGADRLTVTVRSVSKQEVYKLKFFIFGLFNPSMRHISW